MRKDGVDLVKWALREYAPPPERMQVLDVRDDRVAYRMAAEVPVRRQDGLYSRTRFR